VPIDDDVLFLSMLERFLEEDYKGREALQTLQIGLTSPDNSLEY